MAVRAAPLIERERESEALDRLLANARAGSGGALVIEGPPGIGKSRLLIEARESADDFCVLTARGSDLEQAFPFGIVRQLLEPLLAAADEQERDALLAGAGALAGPVLSQIQTNAAFEPPLTALHGLYWFTANAAAQRPLLLLIDDAHWCDGPSLRWLPYVARRADGLRLAMVVTSRSNEPGQVQEAIDELCTLAGASAVRPAPLSEAAVAGMVAQTLHGADAEFLAACYDATGGNGFLVNELVGELVRREIEPTRRQRRACRWAAIGRCRSLGACPPAQPAGGVHLAGPRRRGARRKGGAAHGGPAGRAGRRGGGTSRRRPRLGGDPAVGAAARVRAPAGTGGGLRGAGAGRAHAVARPRGRTAAGRGRRARSGGRAPARVGAAR